jgi:hypothetical protein
MIKAKKEVQTSDSKRLRLIGLASKVYAYQELIDKLNREEDDRIDNELLILRLEEEIDSCEKEADSIGNEYCSVCGYCHN